MKKIIFTMPDGLLSVMHPQEGARFAFSITFSGGQILPQPPSSRPLPVDSFKRGWPISGATADWAETEDAFVARIATKDVPPSATDVVFVEASAIPTDRTFRNAWIMDGNSIGHDMVKCRNIKRDQFRALRKPKMDILDVAYLIADEQGNLAEKQRIAQKKQILRDITQAPEIEQATTVDELKAFLPAALK